MFAYSVRLHSHTVQCGRVGVKGFCYENDMMFSVDGGRDLVLKWNPSQLFYMKGLDWIGGERMRKVTLDMGASGVIRDLRDRGMSMAEIARKAELTESAVYKLWHGERKNLTLETLARLARAYDCQDWQLLRRMREIEHGESETSVA